MPTKNPYACKILSHHPTHAWKIRPCIATCMEWSWLNSTQRSHVAMHAWVWMNELEPSRPHACMNMKSCRNACASHFLTIAHRRPSTSKRVLTLHPNWPWICAPTLVRHTCTIDACDELLAKEKQPVIQGNLYDWSCTPHGCNEPKVKLQAPP